MAKKRVKVKLTLLQQLRAAKKEAKFQKDSKVRLENDYKYRLTAQENTTKMWRNTADEKDKHVSERNKKITDLEAEVNRQKHTILRLQKSTQHLRNAITAAAQAVSDV